MGLCLSIASCICMYYVCLHRCLHLFVSASVSLSFSVSLSLSLSLSLSVPLSLSVSLYLCISVSLCFCLCLSVSLSLCLSVSLSVCLSVSLCVSVSALYSSNYMYTFICVSVTPVSVFPFLSTIAQQFIKVKIRRFWLAAHKLKIGGKRLVLAWRVTYFRINCLRSIVSYQFLLEPVLCSGVVNAAQHTVSPCQVLYSIFHPSDAIISRG